MVLLARIRHVAVQGFSSTERRQAPQHPPQPVLSTPSSLLPKSEYWKSAARTPSQGSSGKACRRRGSSSPGRAAHGAAVERAPLAALAVQRAPLVMHLCNVCPALAVAAV